LVATPEEKANEAADEDGGSEEPTPFGNAYQTHDHHSKDEEESDRVAGPNTRAILAIGDNFLRRAIIVRRSDHPIQRVATERSIRFHDAHLLSRSNPTDG